MLDEQVRNFMKVNNLSQSKMSKMMGIGESTLSRWLKGDYPNPENLEPKIVEFLEKSEKRENANTYTTGKFVVTKMSAEIWNSLEYFRTQRCIGCIFGDAGIGKTRTVMEWSKDKFDVIVLTVKPCFSSSRAFAKLLARQLKSRTSGACDEIYVDIMNRLKGTDKTIIIDEAQHLSLRAIEDLRALNDDPEIQATIVFVGNLMIYKKLKGSQQAEFAQLFSRTIVTNRELVTERFTLDDINKVFKLEDDEANEILLKIARTKYGLRGAINVFENASNNNDITKKGLLMMAKVNGINI